MSLVERSAASYKGDIGITLLCLCQRQAAVVTQTYISRLVQITHKY